MYNVRLPIDIHKNAILSLAFFVLILFILVVLSFKSLKATWEVLPLEASEYACRPILDPYDLMCFSWLFLKHSVK